MAESRIWEFVRRLFMAEKKQRKDNSFKRDITVIYNIGSKSHRKEFKAFALFGLWMAENYWRGIRIVRISVK